jgi:DNA-binding Lrp family transcriptional regulator
MDETDRSIISFFMLHPEATIVELADSLEIARATAQRRVLRLKEEELLKRAFSIAPKALGYTLRYRIDVTINTRAATAKSFKGIAAQIAEAVNKDQKLAERVFIEDILLLMGSSSDLAVVLRAKSYQSVLEYVTESLRRMPGVNSTLIVQEAWSLREVGA